MSAAKPVRHQITSQSEAEALLARIGDSMVALVKIFQEETRLVKAGRLSEATALTSEKAELASQYLREIEMLKANAPFIGKAMPTLVDELRKAHAAFRDILALNLRVVATAQSVAEGIMRGAANEAARGIAPKGYSADGRSSAKAPSRPVVLSRSS
ncbi:MAG: hypothetical protein WD207_10890 [Xanthobacteraceae bacterium]